MQRLRGKEAIGHISDVSLLNFSDELRAEMNLPKRVVLSDLTLREGRQLEGRVLTNEQCLRVARELDELGFPEIQVPFSERYGEEELLDQLIKLGLKARITVMTSVPQLPPTYSWDKQMIVLDKIISRGAIPYLSLCLSNRMLKAFSNFRGEKDRSLDYLKKQQIEMGVKAVQRVKEQKGIINGNVQDPMRCDLDYFDALCKELADSGMNYIVFDDLCCPGTPSVFKYIYRRAKKAVPNGTFGVYVHDDYGFGLGATLDAVEGGAEILMGTVNGFGKRGGMVDLGQLAVVLEFMYGYDTGIRLEKLTEVSRLVADIYREPLPRAKPVTGYSAYAHGADWHVQFAFPEHPDPDLQWVVQSIDPRVVGQKPRVAFYHMSGPICVRAHALTFGITLSIVQSENVWLQLREYLKWRSRPISDEEFLNVLQQTLPDLAIPQRK